jgi:hypothetical protein
VLKFLVFNPTVWWRKHKTLPTLKEIQEVLNMSIDALNQPKHKLEKELFLWYYDDWLPAILPREFWREDIRHYKLLTDTVEIAGKQKVLVTVASEAFGLLMWENCHDKWVNYFKLKDDFGEKAPVPTGKQPGADKHQAKWSDSTSGQVKYGGWKDEAYDFFENLKKELEEWRENEEKHGKPAQKFAFDLMRATHKKKGATPADDKKKPSRKKKASAIVVEPKRRRLTVKDE